MAQEPRSPSPISRGGYGLSPPDSRMNDGTPIIEPTHPHPDGYRMWSLHRDDWDPSWAGTGGRVPVSVRLWRRDRHLLHDISRMGPKVDSVINPDMSVQDFLSEVCPEHASRIQELMFFQDPGERRPRARHFLVSVAIDRGTPPLRRGRLGDLFSQSYVGKAWRRGKALVVLGYDKKPDQPCARCGSASKLRCARCRAPYCSSACQEADWVAHRGACVWRREAGLGAE